MIESIEIEGFRCFKHSKFEGFKEVNLIGGENNSGKTSFLESILISVKTELNGLNNFGPERILNWNELMYGLPEEGKIEFKVVRFQNEETITLSTIYNIGNKGSSLGFKQEGTLIPEPMTIGSKSSTPASVVSERLDIATRNGFEEKWLDGVKCIDSNIESIRTFTIRSNHRIYIKRKGEIYYHNSSQMGDAVNKILEIISGVTQNERGILLIDEIENGIHYSHQEAFWEMLFKLCKEFDVQVFATSHSLEMIKAFNKVAMENGYAESSQYMEMFRSTRSGEIVANAMKHDTLAYSIANHLSFRGEEK